MSRSTGLVAVLNQPRWWRALFALTVVAILVLALAPANGPDTGWPHADKLRHAGAFITLWAIGRRARVQPSWALAVGLFVFGVFIELAQAMTPTRDPSLGDVLADMAGIAAGRLLWGGAG